MMKTFLSLVFILLVIHSSEAGVKFFTGSLREAQRESERTQKPVLVDFYTDWCKWCKVLDKEVYEYPAVSDVITKSFIVVKVDAEKEGVEDAKRYAVKGYPTLVYLDPKGNVIDKMAGYRPPNDFLRALQPILAGKAARAYYEEALAHDPHNAEALYGMAEIVMEEEKYDDAKKYASEVVAKSNNNLIRTGAQLMVAEIQMKKDNNSSLLEAMLIQMPERVNGSPYSDEAMMLSSVYHDLLGFYGEHTEKSHAQHELYEKFVAAFPTDYAPRLEFANYALKTGNYYQHALSYLDEAIVLRPALAAAFAMKSDVLAKLGKNKEAMTAIKKASELKPENAQYKEKIKILETIVSSK